MDLLVRLTHLRASGQVAIGLSLQGWWAGGMPIEYRIDHHRRVVFAVGRGVLRQEDVFLYQREVWSRSDVAGYDELFDTSEVERIIQPSSGSIQELATLSAGMDSPAFISKFTIVAPENLAFGIARMYEAYRELEQRSIKKIAVFRSMKAALEWLGMDTSRFDCLKVSWRPFGFTWLAFGASTLS
jgi:hypothetical protein